MVLMGSRHGRCMAESSIPCSAEMRERVKALKRGGETYEEVLERVLEGYDG